MANVKPSPRKIELRQKSQIMSDSEIERTLVRLAYEIVEKNGGVESLGLVGIKRRGVPIAQRLGKIIARIENAEVPVGILDITFYRDDLSTLGPKPVVQQGESDLRSKIRILFWWMTSCSRGAQYEPQWTLCFRMDGRNACSFAC